MIFIAQNCMKNKMSLTIGLCYTGTNNTEKSLVKNAMIARNVIRSPILEIYAGNNYDCYEDMRKYDTKSIKTLFDLLNTKEYVNVFNLGFKTIVIRAFSINNEKNDNYWVKTGIVMDEYLQFRTAFMYLQQFFPDVEFIVSNQKSDTILSNFSEEENKTVAENMTKLINIRYASKKDSKSKNVKIALEVDKFSSNTQKHFNSVEHVLSKIRCDVVLYSCYGAIKDSLKTLDNEIKYIKTQLSPETELCIGEFDFPTFLLKKDVTSFLKSILMVFRKNQIRLAFYSDLYHNGLGILDGTKTYASEILFNTEIIMVRHAESRSIEWKKNNNTKIISLENGKLFQLYNAELSEKGKIDIESAKVDFWKNVIDISNGKNIIIYCSPLRRALQTCMLSMCVQEPFLLNMFKNIKLYITPLIAETGDDCENKDETEFDITQYDSFIKLKSFVSEIKIMHFEDKSIISKGNSVENVNKFVQFIKTRKIEQETILCFCHFKVIKICTGKQTNNFGIPHYCATTYKN